MIDTSAECCILCFCEIGQTFFQNRLNFFDVLAGKLFQNLATLDIQQTAIEILQVGWQLLGEVISRVSFLFFFDAPDFLYI
jgi:hypothetical protein